MTGDMTAFTKAIQALADSEVVKKRLDAFAKKQQKKEEADGASRKNMEETILNLSKPK